jgi:uracil-DNA glycosylase family 4
LNSSGRLESIFNKDCEKCELYLTCKSVCIPGVNSGKVMVIAEAPSIPDDRVGKLMQGSISRTVEDLFSGIDFYFTTLVKCRVPEQNAPSSTQIKACIEYLHQEIDHIKPELIVTLGATVLKALSKKSKITELHGQLFEYRGYSVIPLYHPAIALRDPTKLPGLKKDVLRVHQLLDGITPSTEEIPWEVVTQNNWKAFIDDLEDSEFTSVDIETNTLNRFEPKAVVNCIQFGTETNNWVFPLHLSGEPINIQKRKLLRIRRACSRAEISGQNFKFDNLFLKHLYGVSFDLDFDTMLAHHLLDENSPHGLKELSVFYCNAPSYDIDIKTKQGKGDINKLYEYAGYDTYYTRQLRMEFRKQLLKQPGLRRLFYKLVMPLSRMFEVIEENGIYINQSKLKQSEFKLTQEKNRLLREMNRLAGKDINWNSPTQIGDLLYKRLKLKVIEVTPTGNPSTSESVLMRLNHPVVKLLLEYRGIEKNLSTYIIGWQKLMHEGRLHLSTKIHGTVTGRMASRLHQVPRDPLIRSHITAPPGYTFVSADYSQIELRLAAMASQDRRMIQVFQVGGDIHSATASFILGKPESKLTKEERKMAKAVNFGLIYGMGWRKLVIYARDNYGVIMTDSEAKAFRDRFFEVYSGFPVWHQRVRRIVKINRQVVSLSGRIRHLPGIDSTDEGVRAEAERQAINSPIQGFGSGDLKAMAMVEIHNEYENGIVKLAGEVHDSILMYIKDEFLDETIPNLKSIMESPKLLNDFNINMTVPLLADFEVGDWGTGKPWKPA